jgi:predicted nucleotidyltransferase
VSGLIVLYLFGSAAAGRLRAESDIDIAFLATAESRALRVFDAAQAAAVALHRDVDLVDLSEASTVMRAQVVGNGRRILVVDEYQANLFEAHALSDYARLQEERSGALRAFTDGYNAR